MSILKLKITRAGQYLRSGDTYFTFYAKVTGHVSPRPRIPVLKISGTLVKVEIFSRFVNSDEALSTLSLLKKGDAVAVTYESLSDYPYWRITDVRHRITG